MVQHRETNCNTFDSPDARFWYCAQSAAPAATLVGVSLPEALRGAAPAQPRILTLGMQGLFGDKQ